MSEVFTALLIIIMRNIAYDKKELANVERDDTVGKTVQLMMVSEA